jgi:hypothetical protein
MPAAAIPTGPQMGLMLSELSLCGGDIKNAKIIDLKLQAMLVS